MPAPVIVVHDEHATQEWMLSTLRAAGHDALGFRDPMTALDAIEADSRLRVLVTRIDFGEGKLNGLALFRMLRSKQPRTRVVFVGRPENGPYVSATGEFLPHPIDPVALVETVGRLLIESG